MNSTSEITRDKLVADAAPADALVFFGASGDFAYKKIFPALQAMVQRGRLSVPVIGVAKSALTNRAAGDRWKRTGWSPTWAAGIIRRTFRRQG